MLPWLDEKIKEEKKDVTAAESTKKSKKKRKKKPKKPKKLKEDVIKQCRRLPVLGFNSGKYDFNVIKKVLMPLFAEAEERLIQACRRDEVDFDERTVTFSIKKGNDFMCISTHKLQWLDVKTSRHRRVWPSFSKHTAARPRATFRTNGGIRWKS